MQMIDNNNSEPIDRTVLISKLIHKIPGIKYSDLARITRFNNGTISHSIRLLEKKNLIMVYRNSDSNIVRYFSPSVPSNDYVILGFFRNNVHRKIILYCTVIDHRQNLVK